MPSPRPGIRRMLRTDLQACGVDGVEYGNGLDRRTGTETPRVALAGVLIQPFPNTDPPNPEAPREWGMMMTAKSDTLEITLSREALAELISSGTHELNQAVVAAQAGEPLADCLVTEWDQWWPIIDTDLKLTGQSTDSQPGFANYNNQAMIDESDALAAGWTITDGYASPPDDDDE